MTRFVNGVFAFTESIPELDGLVSRSRDNLSVISRKSNAQNVFGVTNESSGGSSKIEVPKSESAVPRSRQSELSVRGDNDIRDEVIVSSESFSREAKLLSISSKFPNDEGLVSRASENHIGILSRSSDTSDPSIVSF